MALYFFIPLAVEFGDERTFKEKQYSPQENTQIPPAGSTHHNTQEAEYGIYSGSRVNEPKVCVPHIQDSRNNTLETNQLARLLVKFLNSSNQSLPFPIQNSEITPPRMSPTVSTTNTLLSLKTNVIVKHTPETTTEEPPTLRTTQVTYRVKRLRKTMSGW